MKIGIVTYDFSPPIGGIGVVAKGYADRLPRLFPEHTVVVLSPSPGSHDRVSSFASKRYGRAGGCPLFSLMLSLKLRSLIRGHALDALHVHAGSGGVFLLWKPPIPTVVTAHHTYWQESFIVFRKKPFTRFRKYLIGLLERQTYRRADRITCVSKDTASALAHDYGISPEKIEVTENAVDDVFFRPPPDSARERKETVLFIGRLEGRKGVWTLLEAFALLLGDVPSAHLRLVGENLLDAALSSWIRALHLGVHVTQLGHVHGPLRFREMKEASVLVVPSLLEGFGLVAAEGMAAGACVIASDAPGLRSLIKDGVTGLKFPVGNVQALASVLRRALSDHALRTSLGIAAALEARKRFRSDDRTRDLEKVLRETYQRRSTRSGPSGRPAINE